MRIAHGWPGPKSGNWGPARYSNTSNTMLWPLAAGEGVWIPFPSRGESSAVGCLWLTRYLAARFGCRNSKPYCTHGTFACCRSGTQKFLLEQRSPPLPKPPTEHLLLIAPSLFSRKHLLAPWHPSFLPTPAFLLPHVPLLS